MSANAWLLAAADPGIAAVPLAEKEKGCPIKVPGADLMAAGTLTYTAEFVEMFDITVLGRDLETQNEVSFPLGIL